MTPRKANTPVLTREQIVAAAMNVVDRDGLDSLSMRRLAAELGVGVMSLYYHVPDKYALHDLILDAVLADVRMPESEPGEDAEQRVSGLGYALREALLAHPHAVPLVLSRSFRTPGQLRPVEEMLGVLFDLGLDATDAIAAVDVIGQYVFGTTLAYSNHLAESEAEQRPQEGPDGITPEAFPNLIRAMREAEYVGWDGMFDRGLRAIVRGLVVEKMPAAPSTSRAASKRAASEKE